jgi:demethylmenaquinone methyltransferase/2-methoxy-6-polyprenyl-1,4-benzoquinol methylase
MRNTADLKLALKEQIRLLNPGGRIVILDTTRPKTNLFTPFIWLHMHLIIPALGRLVTGDRQAYEYLSNSSERFLFAEELAAKMNEAGFTNIAFKRYMFGTIAIHWGIKPRTSRKMIKSKHD